MIVKEDIVLALTYDEAKMLCETLSEQRPSHCPADIRWIIDRLRSETEHPTPGQCQYSQEGTCYADAPCPHGCDDSYELEEELKLCEE